MRLVNEVHKKISQIIKPGDLAIDATVGNGYDTEFLVKLGAMVIGFDIQEEAIRRTNSRVGKELLLYREGHERMLDIVPKEWIGRVGIVMFNLGYLPGGDKSIITRSETTLKGLENAYCALKEGGYLSVMVYPDHQGGADEALLVKNWMANLLDEVNCVNLGRGPLWYWVRKN